MLQSLRSRYGGKQRGAEVARKSTCLCPRLERQLRFVHGPYLIALQTLQTQKKVARAFRNSDFPSGLYGVNC